MKKKSHEQYVSEVIEKLGDEYIFHSKYTKSSDSIEVEHKLCGYKWNPIANNFLHGKSRCPECSGKRHMSASEFSQYVKEETKGEFSSLGDFKGIRYITTFKHNKCGYTFEAFPFHVRKGELGCRNCSNMLVHDKERVELLLKEKYGSEYVLISDEVKNNRDPIIILHNECDKEFETTSTSIINIGKGCPYCNKQGSNGELKIEKYLKSNSINHIREYTFDDCRYKGLLFFDFAIFDENDNLIGLIEFDGKQHFEPIGFFGGEEGFKESKIRDEIKNKYCKNNNITLLRIPYWEEDNIEAHLSNFLENIVMEVV